jgi:solute:Na+ symporter, SSS family
VIRRNAVVRLAYSLVLGLIALFGYLARAAPAVNAGVKADGGNPQLSVPLLFARMFPSWFAGIGNSAIVFGALVRRPSCRSRRRTCLPGPSIRS